MQQTRHKTKLMTLTCRRSAKGVEYLYGFLGETEVIAFKGDPNAWGDTWNLFIQERAPKAPQGHGTPRHSQRDQAAADLFQRPLDRR